MKFSTFLLPVAAAAVVDIFLYGGSGRKRVFESIYKQIDDSKQAAKWLGLRAVIKPQDVKILEYDGTVQVNSFLVRPVCSSSPVPKSRRINTSHSCSARRTG